MTLILVQQGRGTTRNVVMYDADGNAIIPKVADRVRIRIGRQGEDDKLSFTDDTPTAAGSSVTKGETNVVRLDATDLNFGPGTFSFFVDYFDVADASEWKEVDRQCIVLEPTE